jgi:gamma-glutamyl:cysteine ligase YbdK (ATP-grasp superfamily)
MGQEITSSKFTQHDFSAFSQRLRVETDLLCDYFHNHRFDTNHDVGGFEVEAWLVDKNALPSSVNEKFLLQLNDPMVVHELASFNIELNVLPQSLQGYALQKLQDELNLIWNKCRKTAMEMNTDIMAIGIHPAVREEQLTLQYMSKSKRYRALNEQVIAIRQGKPLTLHIRGHDHMETTHHDVMLEAGTTSFQIHLQITQDKAVRAYNASQIASAPLVAVSANSPFIFGYALWDESRIPLFQQSVDVGEDHKKRVTFSHDYARGSLFSCFLENIEDYPVLIPVLFEEKSNKFPHLRFHNGTIWRWNRPLIGFGDDGSPHLRIENRVVPSGPTTADMIANAAFYWGLVQSLTALTDAPENNIHFPVVRQNFYNAARYSLESSIQWLDGELHPIKSMLLHLLLPMARDGLLQLGINETDCNYYLQIIEKRITTGQNGAAWQRLWVEKHGRDMDALSKAYLEHQHSQRPVHEWDI